MGIAVFVQVDPGAIQVVNQIDAMEGFAGKDGLGSLLVSIIHGFDNNLLVVGDHALDVVPAVADGDLVAQDIAGIAVQIFVPASVVVPALKLVRSGGGAGGRVVVLDLQPADAILSPGGQVGNDFAGIGGIRVAVAVDPDHHGV